MYFIFLQSTHCIKKTLTVSCTLLCESGDRVKVDKSSFSAYLHAVMLCHHCSEYGELLADPILSLSAAKIGVGDESGMSDFFAIIGRHFTINQSLILILY